MLTRRKLVLGAALAVLVPAAPALAAPDPLLADILAASGSTITTGTILRLRLRTVRRLRVTGLRGPRNLRAEGLREDRVRGHRSLRTAAVRVRLTSEGRAAGARAVQAVPADAAAPQSAPRRA